ncbi:MAG TPA: carbon-nitrogen family hydrolase [Methylomirabilota bacterium]|nr:carbon-nitrogen family hydrolase [Methylomirabilota bacterium]
MQVTCCQLDIVWENKQANFTRVEQLLSRATVEPNGLIVLPEMFATGFSMNVEAIHEAEHGETAAFLQQLARRTRSWLVAGVTSKGADSRGRNIAAVFSPEGESLLRYTKCQPFSAGGECDHYTAGTEIQTFKCGDFLAAPFVCYDLRFPELFRVAALKGAELLVVIANWPAKRVDHWATLLRARAIENQAYVIGVNRPGKDPFHQYPGRSMVVDPHGNVLGELHDTEGLVQTHIDSATVQAWRRDFPALRDIRKAWFAGV